MKAVELSSYIIKYAKSLDLELTQMQLQKLLFLTEIESFKRFDKPLIDEDFMSFDHGPVITSLYSYVSEQGSLPLNPFVDIHIDDKKLRDSIEFVVNKYAKFSASYLRNYTHHFYSWENYRNKIMSKEAIKRDCEIIKEAEFLAQSEYEKVKDLILDQ